MSRQTGTSGEEQGRYVSVKRAQCEPSQRFSVLWQPWIPEYRPSLLAEQTQCISLDRQEKIDGAVLRRRKEREMYYLVQVNVGRIRAPLTDPMMAEYMALRPMMDALARRSPGFIWRRNGVGSQAKETDLYDDPMIIANVSVWATLKEYYNSVYKSEHLGVINRRSEWFEHFDGPSHVMWWVQKGHLPTAEEAKERLEYLRSHGDTPYAFSFEKHSLHQMEPPRLLPQRRCKYPPFTGDNCPEMWLFPRDAHHLIAHPMGTSNPIGSAIG
jgi:Domain of unknown function (DUF3291)